MKTFGYNKEQTENKFMNLRVTENREIVTSYFYKLQYIV